jgi:integrase/recombinase XerD
MKKKTSFYASKATVNCDSETMIKLREAMKNSFRDRAMLETLNATGIKTQELCNIQINDVDLKERQINIYDKNRTRTVFFTPLCKEWLSIYLASRIDSCAYLFITKTVRPFHPTGIRQLLGRYCKQENLTAVSPSAFRRKFATDMVKNKFSANDISYFMGYRSLQSFKQFTRPNSIQ